MAITKIHAIKSTLGKALAYIENPDKTDGQMLVSGYNCEPQTASIDFEMTAVLAHKARNLKRKRSTNLAYHLIQSFSPEDAVTPEQAHELGKKLAFEYTGGKYEYVVATHIDKGYIHNHIMINAVSFYDYKKLRTVPYRTARQIRDISDRLCMEAHLSVIDDPQKIGQLYPENAGKKKSVSNRTEIRKRLNFCLERATDYSQFLSMAKELKITPTIRGKHMSYLLEGTGRAVRDNSLSDTDTFTYAGICARLSDNAQEQKYLRETITGILSSATGMADFADKLKVAGIETKVKKATGQVLYRAAVLDGAWIPEDALGSEFTSEGIEYALKNGKMQLSDGAENSLLDRYQKLTIRYPEVCTAAVKLSSRQILSAGKNGLVLQIHDDNGNPAKLMVNKSEVTTSPDGEIIFNVGNDFSYDLVYEDGTHGTIRGTKLIQQIDEENNVLPLAVVLTEDQIKTMSLRGVTIALPSKGIERLFIPEKYVVCNAANGQCAVSLYPNHQYSYIPTSGENKRNSIQGDQLAAILGVAINPSTENTTLSRRIAAVERRMGIENAKNLGKVLLGMTRGNMYTAADYDKVILSLGKKQIQLLRVLCAAVVLAACVGVFTTGAWAFNTQTFRTPTETLEMGTFSVCVDDKVPDENGTYNLGEGEYSIILHAYGNMPSLVLTSWTPEGEAAQQYIVYLDPTCEEDPSIEISVSTYKSMTLTLTPIAECPEEVKELPDQIVVAAPPAQVEPTDEAPENPQEKTGETENTSTVNIHGSRTKTAI